MLAQLAAVQEALAARLAEISSTAPEAASATPDRAITVEEVANRLSFTPQYTYGLIKRHELPAIKTGKYYRVRESDLSAWMASHTENPLDNGLYNLYSNNHGRKRTGSNQKGTRLNSGANGGSDRRGAEHGSAMGAGRVKDIRAYREIHSPDCRDGKPE